VTPETLDLEEWERQIDIEFLTVFDVETGMLSKPICEGSLSTFAVSPDGRLLAVQSFRNERNEIHIYDMPPQPPLWPCLLFSAPPALLFMGVLWRRVR
jgi:hypothetical protein